MMQTTTCGRLETVPSCTMEPGGTRIVIGPTSMDVTYPETLLVLLMRLALDGTAGRMLIYR